MDMLQGIKVMSKDGSLRPIKYALKNKRIVIYLFSASFVNRPEFMSKLKSVYQESLKRSLVLIMRVNFGLIYIFTFQTQEWKLYTFPLIMRRKTLSTTLQ